MEDQKELLGHADSVKVFPPAEHRGLHRHRQPSAGITTPLFLSPAVAGTTELSSAFLFEDTAGVLEGVDECLSLFALGVTDGEGDEEAATGVTVVLKSPRGGDCVTAVAESEMAAASKRMRFTKTPITVWPITGSRDLTEGSKNYLDHHGK